MARTARNAKLNTRSARAKLAIRREPYWVTLQTGLAVGYRRIDLNRGTWIARVYDDATRTRRYQALGDADDTAEADGLRVLTLSQAQEAARAWQPRAFLTKRANANSADSSPETVAEAVKRYAAWLDAHRKPTTAKQAAYQAATIEKAPIGAVRLDKLTAAHLRRWRDAIVETPAQHRTAKPGESPEQTRRKRQSSANRALTTLKAALRHVERNHPGAVPGAPWESVEPFKGADAPRVRWLDRDEIKRLLNAAPEDLGRLIRAALLSGCRYGELCRLRCADFHLESATLHIGEAKAGARNVPLDDEARAFFAGITAGRPRGEIMLRRANGKPWNTDDQKRPMARASEAARLDPPATLHALRHTYASLRIMRGAPLPAIAKALGHSGTRMAEGHYGHLAPSWVHEAIRATALGIGDEEKAEKVARLATV